MYEGCNGSCLHGTDRFSYKLQLERTQREENDRADFDVTDDVFYIVYYDARILWDKLEGIKMSHKVTDRVGRAKKRSQSSFR